MDKETKELMNELVEIQNKFFEPEYISKDNLKENNDLMHLFESKLLEVKVQEKILVYEYLEEKLPPRDLKKFGFNQVDVLREVSEIKKKILIKNVKPNNQGRGIEEITH